MIEPVQKKCQQCGKRPAFQTSWCFICQLASRHATYPPRSSPGNISDHEIRRWMEKKLRDAFEEMLGMMRKDLEALGQKWNPPAIE